jgi:RES domain-containing protein
MLVEIGHGFAHRFDLLTICTYNVDVDDIVDLRTESGRAAEMIDPGAMSCPWAYDLACGRRPASWEIAKRLIARGAAGILTPSFATGARSDMANLVLWRWGYELPHKVEVHDPTGRLPKDQSSWPAT